MPTTRDDLVLNTAHLAYLLDTAGDGFVLCDATQSIVLINKEAERIFGYEEGELLGESVQRLMPHRYRAQHEEAFRKRLRNPAGMPIRYVEGHGLSKDETELPIEVRFTYTPLGDTLYFAGSVRDVSAQVAARQELERRAEEIERLKDALEQERDYLREEVRVSGRFGELIGDSPALRMVLAQIEAVAKTNATVLVTGETGVGKELVARAIHMASPRASAPLVKVNCGSIPKELFESEFFGHRKGSFTGASRDRVGRFRLAHRGTLFLDEIGEIPLELQSKLLRVLQEQEFEPVGDERTHKVDVRIVAATNRDLIKEVAEGRFREDLFYRLGVFPIGVPALRERREDIVPLALHFLELAAKDLNVPRPEVPKSVARRLQFYAWPGNIRELQHVMERAVILSGGAPLRAAMLSIAGQAGDRTAASSRRASAALDASASSAHEATAIRQALEQHVGNVQRAARALGMSRQALYRRMEKHGIARPPRRRPAPTASD
jgi:PAS domain S-box-containing protein